MPYIIPIGKEVEKQKIEEVFQQLITRHESFRTSFQIQGEIPVQVIHEEIDFKVEKYSIEKSIVENFRKLFTRPFDLSQAPILRVGLLEIKGEDNLLMIDMHHIISDGTSHDILGREFHSLYSEEELSPLKLQYRDYSEWQNSKEQQDNIQEQEDYWINKFEGEIPVITLPTDNSRPVIQSYEGAKVSFVLNNEETEKIKIFAQRNGLTLYMSILSVFNIFLSKLSGQEEIVVGTPIAGRKHADLEHIVGMFVNTLAIRNEVKGDESFSGFVAKLKQVTIESFEHQDYQFENLVDKVSVERDISRNPLFDVMFNLLNQSEYSGDLSNVDTQKYAHTPGLSKFDLTLTAIDFGEQLLFNLEYCTKLFSVKTINKFIEYLKRIINQIPDKLYNAISEIELLNEREKQELLYEFNDTKADYPKNKTIHQLFEEQAEKTPNKTAIIFKDKQLTYKELNARSNQLGHYLTRKGITSNEKVALIVDRSFDLIIGILGILKSGGAYIPIDSSYPESHIEYIVNNSEPKLILTEKDHVGKLKADIPIQIIDAIELEKEGTSNLSLNASSSDLSYVIYTSGSTGIPKGVMIEHLSVVNLLYFLQDNYPIQSHDSYLLKTSYCFDVSISELFGWILGGGKLSILEKDLEKDPAQIVEYVNNHQITHINFVPTVFKSFYQSIPLEDRYRLNSLKYIMIAGEALFDEYIKIFKEFNIDAQIINMYGPTEATVYASHFTVLLDSLKPISIGKPISNYEILILGNNMELQPIGVSGELMISGVGLSRGYINKDELTAEKFIRHPFKEGERLYRTGDIARWLPDGNIEFLGRKDDQVKIRGFRIELGEIENTLLKHENIKESVVLAREDKADKYLCAYIVCGKEFNQKEIRNYLLGLLPDYMIPSYFVEMDSIPLTISGKVNRKALPEPEIIVGSDFVAPRNEIEEKLVEIWSEVLGVEKKKISVTSNFFELGGNSLRAQRLISIIFREVEVKIPLMEMFKIPTIVQLANLIHKNELKITIDDDNLVLLKEGDINGENIFLIHDGSGEVDSYIEFCKQAIDGINYWGIGAGSLKKYEPTEFNIEQLATRYIKCLKKVQKQGEYNIAGWSIGGTIAFEMVRQLEQEKENIRFFGIIDSRAPIVNGDDKTTEFTVESELGWIMENFNDELLKGLNIEMDLKDFWIDAICYIKDIEGATEIIREEIFRNTGLDINEYKKVSIEELVKFMNFTRSLSVAWNNYIPGNIINTQINYFAASDSKNLIIEKWDKFSRKPLIEEVVEGTHFSIFKVPNVKGLCEKFEKCLINVNRKA
jgi:amino acid adenylation domain-containing protein